MGRKSLPEVIDGYGGPPGSPERVESPSLRTGTGWEALTEVQEGSGGPPRGPGRVGGNPEDLRRV